MLRFARNGFYAPSIGILWSSGYNIHGLWSIYEEWLQSSQVTGTKARGAPAWPFVCIETRLQHTHSRNTNAKTTTNTVAHIQ